MGMGVPLPRVLVHLNGPGLEPVGAGFTLPGMSGGCLGFAYGCTGLTYVYTDANGIAAVSVTIGTTAGERGATAYTDIPTLYEFPWGATSSNPYYAAVLGWTITIEPGDPTEMVIESGNGQAGTAGGTLGLPLAVRLIDQYGNGVPGVTVSWSVTSGGGTTGAETTNTDAEGRASNTWTLGPTAGTQTVTAGVNGVSATFTATAAAP